ncbi:PAS domain-containing protein [bacterium]|nr:PAS domain-containing protein [bacterium]
MQLMTLLNWILLITFASLAHVALYRFWMHEEHSFRRWGVGWFVSFAAIAFFLIPVQPASYLVPQVALYLAAGVLFLDAGLQAGGKHVTLLPLAATLGAWLVSALLVKLEATVAVALLPAIITSAFLYFLDRRSGAQESHFKGINLPWLHRFRLGWVIFLVLFPTWVLLFSYNLFTSTMIPFAAVGVVVFFLLLGTHHTVFNLLRKIKDEEHTFKMFIQHSSDLFYHVSFQPVLHIHFLSPVVEELVGINREVFYQHPRLLLTIIHPDDRNLLGSFRDLDNPAVPIVLRWRDRNGNTIWTEAYNRLERNALGEVVGCEGMLRDVTYEREARERLEESNARQQQMLEDFPAMIWRSDPDCGRVYLNQQWLTFRGRSMAEEVGHGWLDGIHPEDLERKRRICIQAHETHQPFEMEFRLRRQDGQYRTLLERGVPSFNGDGTFIGFTGFCFDITERKVMEQQLLQANRMEAVSRISRNVAHEFNNLLAVIAGNADLLSLKMPETNDLNQHLIPIKQACIVAQSLTRQLQSFSGSIESKPYLLDLNELIEEMLPMLKRVVGREVELVLAPAEGQAIVKADGRQVEMILLNLVTNARDALKEGGLIRIEIEKTKPKARSIHSSKQTKPMVQVLVTYTGSGISPELVPHLFEPFFTTKEGDKGTGLGLPTSRKLAEQNGGTLRLHSKEGIGTTVILELQNGEGINENGEEFLGGMPHSQSSEEFPAIAVN